MVNSIKAGIQNMYIEVNGWRIRYLKAGSGPPVVLVHGGASDSRDWIETMTALGDRYTFYAPDLIGFGDSERNEEGYYLSDFTNCLYGFIEKLKLEAPALVGHSFGGRMCLDIAYLYPDRISKLVLMDTSGLGKISLFGGVLFSGFAGLRKIMGKRQPFPRFLAKEGEDYNYPGDEALKKIKAPTLLIWKSRDPYMSIKLARKAQKLIPGAKLTVVEGYGHAPHQHENAEFNKILVDFLTGE